MKVSYLSPIILLITLITYLAILFWVARVGDRHRFNTNHWSRHPLVYTLALGVYCTSWTFFGLVGTAASSGWYYLPILLGPALLFSLGFPILRRIAAICREEHIHSIADFISSRFGKRQSVAAIVTLILLIATIPYIALQLKAVSDTLFFLMDNAAFASEDLTLFVTAAMVMFTLIFGASRLNIANYHAGIMTAIAFESVIKLAALIAVAIFALSISQGFDPSTLSNNANSVFKRSVITPSFWVLTLISATSIFCLPRMFQVTFVECLSEKHIRSARTGFVLYLLAIIATIFTIAWTGNQILSGSLVASDTYVLALPISFGSKTISLIAFIGGFSAATAMIIVESLTLSQMLSNDVILPLWIRTRNKRSAQSDYSKLLILTRRLTVIVVIFMAWLYQHEFAENVALTEIGLLAFALSAQLAPAILFGLYWQRANAVGLLAGLASGTLIWFITLMIPLLCKTGLINNIILQQGLFGISFLSPENLFNFTFSDSYTRGVVMSLAANIIVFFLLSTQNITRLTDRIQALAFVDRFARVNTRHLHITKSDINDLLSQFLGASATERLMETTLKTSNTQASTHDILLAEQALSGVVGVSSARALLNNLSHGEKFGVEDVIHIFEETTRTLQFNQDMLFASFESISCGISVVNAELQIVAWNKRYEQMFNYPNGMLIVGRPVSELIHYNAGRGMLGAGDLEKLVQNRLEHLMSGGAYRVVRHHNQSVIEIKGRPLPKGGYVTTYDDISEFISAQTELEKANEHLEMRVKERTFEIEKINNSLLQEVEKRRQTEVELIQAKAIAETANASKTHFIAIASHDILQPLNAANLYASALLESPKLDRNLLEKLQNVQNAIGSAELILSNLLEISRLDTGIIKPQIKIFPLGELLTSLATEVQVQVAQDVTFHFINTQLWTESDPNYLRRILQNFLSNAVKYTLTGKILFGCKRRGSQIEICIFDTGPGISEQHKEKIFDDFYRVECNVEGAGLGLGIAMRFSRLLDHKIQVSSQLGKGSVFSVVVPLREAEVNIQDETHIDTQSSLKEFVILYIDDDEHNLHALNALVSNWGCTLKGTTSANDALSLSKNEELPDAIIIDFQLGTDLNGIELAKKINMKWKNIPICIVSAAPDENLSSIAMSKGFDFLKKPIKPSKLRALLECYAKK